jgi:hypothetical protein
MEKPTGAESDRWYDRRTRAILRQQFALPLAAPLARL